MRRLLSNVHHSVNRERDESPQRTPPATPTRSRSHKRQQTISDEMSSSSTENEGMRDVIHTINQLQDVFTTTGVSIGLDLPQIAVVGGQSAGKSSVLENFVGKDFLPRGSGIVTRRPLILQLYNNLGGGEWAQFLHREDKFTDFNKVREEIEAETERECPNKGLSNKAIRLQVYSPHVLNLTLVDLPGMTKVAVGDQPENIEEQIYNMIMEYIRPANTIILAVTPATQDLSNSDALKLAREVDRDGDRTIGVITKLDMMDKGTDARNILENKFLPLKKGYVGVVNRSQQDINEKKDIKKALAAEKQFFMESPYKSMVDKTGTKYLQQVLNRELSDHIKEKLPEIRSELLKKCREVEEELDKCGYDEKSTSDHSRVLFKLLTDFVDEMYAIIDGNTDELNTDKLMGGVLINRTFYSDFNKFFEDSLKWDDQLEKEIAFAIANSHGYRTPLFVPEKAFDKIVQKLLGKYEAPLITCVQRIREILEDVLDESMVVLNRYPKLKSEVIRLVKKEMDSNTKKAEAQLLLHIDAQKAFMNTRHPDFKNPYPQGTMSAGGQEIQAMHQVITVPEGGHGHHNGDHYQARERKMSVVAQRHVSPSNSSFFVPTEQTIQENYQFSGKLNIMIPASKTVKQASCSITKAEFSFTIPKSTFFSAEMRETISLNNVECQSKSMGDTGARIFILQTTNNRPVMKAYRTLECQTDSKEEAENWVQAFTNVGIYREIHGSMANIVGLGIDEAKAKESRKRTSIRDLRKLSSLDVLEDSHIKDQSGGMLKMIENYFKIVDVEIRDIAPKYIMLTLVRATQMYAKKDLAGDIFSDRQTEKDKAELLQVRPEFEERMKELVLIRNTTKTALEIFSNIK